MTRASVVAKTFQNEVLRENVIYFLELVTAVSSMSKLIPLNSKFLVLLLPWDWIHSGLL